MKAIKQYFDEHKIDIDHIKLNREKAWLEFEVHSGEIVPYDSLHTIEEECQRRNKALKKVKILVTYNGEKTVSEQMSKSLPNIEYILSKHCPAGNKIESCYHIDCQAEERKIVVHVKDKVVMKSLQDKKIGKQIQKSLQKNLALELQVELKDRSETVDEERFFAESDSHFEKIVSELAFRKQEKKDTTVQGDVLFGRAIAGALTDISQLDPTTKGAVIEGYSFASGLWTGQGKTVQSFGLCDHTASIMCKLFLKDENELIKNGSYIKVRGDIGADRNTGEMVFNIKDINKAERIVHSDHAEKKRVELHLHTNMSSMQAIEDTKALIKKAAEFGHRAVAITDYGVVQAFPDAMDQAKKSGIKVLYGMEGYLIDDTKRVLKEYNQLPLEQDFVVFDIETTGLSAQNDRITEIGAVKISNGVITARYNQLVNPERKLSPKIVELTGITDEMLQNQPTIDQVLPEFLSFAQGSVLVAHNSDFDTGFIRESCRRENLLYNFIAIDTVALSRALLTDMKSHKLNLVAKRLGISLENHHRAVDDAQATAEIFLKFMEMFRENGVQTLDQVNQRFTDTDFKSKRPNHIVLLAQNPVGLKNLYKIVSDSNIKHFYKVPRILKSVLNRHREGLLLGSACESGELYQAVLAGKSTSELENIISYYDYLEIMPCDHNEFLIKNGTLNSKQDLQNINKKIFELGKKNGKLVVATGDVRYIEKQDAVIMDIFSAAKKYAKSFDNGAFYFRTTEEMLEEFAYLGEENAQEAVIENTNRIADSIEEFKPIPDGTYPPIIEGSDTQLREMCYEKAKRIYGEELPELVQSRLEKELNSIIGNGYAVMYIIAQKLVTKSIEEGYLVGSRGSVGSSFAATMSDITEVNPLPPHYICPNCRYGDFEVDKSIASGMDLPDKKCAICGSELIKEGHDIPFEVFLGFEGDKEPDIDLNFAGEYQARAHKYTEELFGEEYVFRAGTIGTIAEKTAYGYVQKYAEDYKKKLNTAEILRLRDKSTGAKRTTGQHPGGVMVVPKYKDIYDFTPIQYPANDSSSGVMTTHFDYNALSGRILKLDILGHDVPTIIKMLEDFTQTKATDIKLDDKKTMQLFTSTKSIHCDLSAISCKTGTLGIPEFGTKFVRQMLMDTQPTSFAELLQISGLSHGTDVWLNNAQELIKKGTVTLKDVISTRDDIMNYLIQKDLKPLTAFKIMENVRKGKGLTDEHIEAMREKNVPPWYIESCQKIKYMFPKAHAAAYVMMSFRIAYYKVFYKEAFYATFFTTKVEDFDLNTILGGKTAVLTAIREIEAKGKEASVKEKGQLAVFEVAYEMYQRGVEILKVDIYRSDATKFKIVDKKLLPPLIAIEGLGETVAQKIMEEASREFISQEDFVRRTKASRTVMQTLLEHGCLTELPQSNQLSLF